MLAGQIFWYFVTKRCSLEERVAKDVTLIFSLDHSTIEFVDSLGLERPMLEGPGTLALTITGRSY